MRQATMNACLIYATWPADDAVIACARDLVEARLAACVTILDGGRSTFRWDDQIQEEAECVMLVKTTLNQADKARAAIIAAHPYDLPCVLVLPVDATHSNADFLAWIAKETAT
jgi:periplasmic divalent cation tolerance protein